jgi:hypothetical protein
MAYDAPRSCRPVTLGRRGAVASNHPLATQAVLIALQAGGSAVDAAVAVAATLSVVELMMSGLGGDGFYPLFVRKTGEASRGRPVVTLGDLEGPYSVEIIRRDPASGVLMAGSEPRRDGWALAY